MCFLPNSVNVCFTVNYAFRYTCFSSISNICLNHAFRSFSEYTYGIKNESMLLETHFYNDARMLMIQEW